MDQNVHNFIRTINPNYDPDDKDIFHTILNNIDSDSSAELSYVKAHPDILPLKIRHSTVFDFFYEKVVNNKYHPAHTTLWHDSLTTVIKLLNKAKDGDTIKNNKKYILRLQGTCKTLTKIFELLINEEFDMGDPEFLVYSIIARGELVKLQILSKLYVIEDYPGVLDVALRFGRNTIIAYFKDVLSLEFPYYGKIMDFENYIDNPRYVYYREHIAHDDTIRNKAIVGATKQDYPASINLILENYQYPITCRTVEKWCDLIRNKEFVWDKINPTDILPLLTNKLDSPLPLTCDFGDFNTLIHGPEWSDRKCLVQQCLHLQKKLDESEYRRSLIEDRYRHIQEKYDTILRFIEDRSNYINHRTRKYTC